MSLRYGMKRRSSCALGFPHGLVRLRPDGTSAVGGLTLVAAGQSTTSDPRARAALPSLLWCDIPPLGQHKMFKPGGPSVVKIILMIGAILMLWSSNATTQERVVGGKCRADLQKHIRDVSLPCLVMLAKFAEVRRFRKDCSAHIRQQCASAKREGGEFEDCLKSAVDGLSDTCKDALARAVRRARTSNVRPNSGPAPNHLSAGPTARTVDAGAKPMAEASTPPFPQREADRG